MNLIRRPLFKQAYHDFGSALARCLAVGIEDRKPLALRLKPDFNFVGTHLGFFAHCCLRALGLVGLIGLGRFVERLAINRREIVNQWLDRLNTGVVAVSISNLSQ